MSAKPGRFAVLKAFYMSGTVIETARVIELDDAGLINELLSAGRIEAADPATHKRVRYHRPVWRPVGDWELRHGHGDPRWIRV